MKRWLKRLGIAFAAMAVSCAIPITYVETSCIAPPATRRPPEVSAFAIPAAGYRRAEGDSYLTYPEWYIVHAYADLAGVTRQASESAFDYLSSVMGFWRALCHATEAAGRTGEVTTDQKATNYIIGLSFTAEMTVTGGYERSVGAMTAWLRGAKRTGEDEFALAMAEDYAVFLRQTPWYQYPFWEQIWRFWRETPWGQGNLIRGVERRIALTLEYGGRGLYAIGIGALAGVSPADLTIQSVVSGLTAADAAGDPRIRIVRDLGAGAVLIETPRYREFTHVLRGLGRRGRDVLEISGNQRILVTILAPESAAITSPGVIALFSIPIQSRPGWRRLGMDAEVKGLTGLIGAVELQGAEFEHAYDY